MGWQDGRTPLHNAADKDDSEATQVLLGAGADKDAKDKVSIGMRLRIEGAYAYADVQPMSLDITILSRRTLPQSHGRGNSCRANGWGSGSHD